MMFVDDKQQKHDESTKNHATKIRITSITRHQKRFSTSNTKVSKNNAALIARSDQGIMRLLGRNPRIRGGGAPRVVVCKM